MKKQTLIKEINIMILTENAMTGNISVTTYIIITVIAVVVIAAAVILGIISKKKK